MAMNCREFLDTVTQVGVTQIRVTQVDANHVDGLLNAGAAAHLRKCDDCQAWYAAAQPALALFATAGCGHAGGADPQRFAGGIAVYVESDVAPVEPSSPLSSMLRERGKISAKFTRPEDAEQVRPPAAVEVGQADEDESAPAAAVATVCKSANQRLSDALLRIAAGVVILLLVLSFLQQPQDAEVANAHTPAQLLQTNATLDSLGLVAACVEPQQLDVHSALVADHFGDLSCCTRCHQAANSAMPSWANGRTGANGTLAGSGHAMPKLSEAKRNLLAESCLLCHQG